MGTVPFNFLVYNICAVIFYMMTCSILHNGLGNYGVMLYLIWESLSSCFHSLGVVLSLQIICQTTWHHIPEEKQSCFQFISSSGFAVKEGWIKYLSALTGKPIQLILLLSSTVSAGYLKSFPLKSCTVHWPPLLNNITEIKTTSSFSLK